MWKAEISVVYSINNCLQRCMNIMNYYSIGHCKFRFQSINSKANTLNCIYNKAQNGHEDIFYA